jgi:hypothetical protein
MAYRGAVYFEIPVVDLDRATRFYSELLGVALERAEVDGNQAAFFPLVEGAGVSGALMCGESYVPSRDGTRVYLQAGPVETALARAVALGAKVLYPQTNVGEMGTVAEFEDCEGNRIALHEPAR